MCPQHNVLARDVSRPGVGHAPSINRPQTEIQGLEAKRRRNEKTTKEERNGESRVRLGGGGRGGGASAFVASDRIWQRGGGRFIRSFVVAMLERARQGAISIYPHVYSLCWVAQRNYVPHPHPTPTRQ